MKLVADDNWQSYQNSAITKENETGWSDGAELEKLLSIDAERQMDACALRSIYEVPSASMSLTAKFELAILVDTSIKERARRSQVLPPSLFADPAWDMLLDLYRAELREFRVSVSSLCIASHVPASTALRWISNLKGCGLVARDADPLDARRFFMRLTAAGSMAMTLYFSMHSTAERRAPCAH